MQDDDKPDAQKYRLLRVVNMRLDSSVTCAAKLQLYCDSDILCMQIE